jgi:MSHA biogenesis protein MshK
MKTLSNPYLATLLLTMTAQSALADRLVDPTRPTNTRAASPAEKVSAAPVRLEAILRSDGVDIAIVNGKVVRAGERVGTTRIDAILPDGIRYTRDGRTHTARLDSKSMQVRRNVVPNEDET